MSDAAAVPSRPVEVGGGHVEGSGSVADESRVSGTTVKRFLSSVEARAQGREAGSGGTREGDLRRLSGLSRMPRVCDTDS